MNSAQDKIFIYRFAAAFSRSTCTKRKLGTSIALYMHEGNPGHHFQSMFAIENEELPEFSATAGSPLSAKAGACMPKVWVTNLACMTIRSIALQPFRAVNCCAPCGWLSIPVCTP